MVSLLKQKVRFNKNARFFDFTEQTEIVKREKRKHLEARQDWQRAPKIIVTEEYIALDKKLEPIEEELFELIKKCLWLLKRK